MANLIAASWRYALTEKSLYNVATCSLCFEMTNYIRVIKIHINRKEIMVIVIKK